MKSKTLSEKSSVDTLKLIAAVAVLVAGVIGFYVYENQPQLYRVLGMLAVVAVAVAISVTTNPGKALWEFLQESRTEVRKVVWPTRQETIQTTLIVLVVVILVAIFLWLLDMFLFWAVDAIVRPGGR